MGTEQIEVHGRWTTVEDQILQAWRRLEEVRRWPSYRDWLPGKKRYQEHQDRRRKLQRLLWDHPEALARLLRTASLTEAERMRLLLIGFDGSVREETNYPMREAIAKLREQQADLPEEIRYFLDWLKITHGW